jgi:hypothetical protein
MQTLLETTIITAGLLAGMLLIALTLAGHVS